MTLRNIYKYVTERFEFYRSGDKKWKNSLRHNLSFNDCFIKVATNEIQDKTRGRKGNYWTLHPKCRGMFCQGSTLRRKRRFREKDMGGYREDEGKSLRKPNSVDERHLSETCQPQPSNNFKATVFYDRPIEDKKSSELELDKGPIKLYESQKTSPNGIYSSDAAMRRKTLSSSTFTIENILKSNKKENAEEEKSRAEYKSLASVPGHYSHVAWKPVDTRRQHANETCGTAGKRDGASTRFSIDEIEYRQSECNCIYCRRSLEEIRCHCHLCLARYYTS